MRHPSTPDAIPSPNRSGYILQTQPRMRQFIFGFPVPENRQLAHSVISLLRSNASAIGA
jgi:hypothetical protein